MLNSTLWLTLATLAGLAAGFAREWLLVADWGAGSRSDAFLVAMFLPEALRMTLAGGLLSGAALALYRERDEAAARNWLNGLTPWFLLAGLVLAALLAFGAPLWVRLIGLGLGEDARAQAVANLRLLAACAPGFLLHALLSVPLQARERFIAAGLGSLLFNLPLVAYLGLTGHAAAPTGLALACVLGSVLMPVSLARPCWQLGWRGWSAAPEARAGRALLRRLGPLLGSNLASQGLALLERLVASLLGEGAVTWANLARKLINLPLIALMNLGQVLLGMMSARQDQARLAVLRQGLATATVLSAPAALGLVAAGPSLIAMLLPNQAADSPLATLLAWFAATMTFGAWNALLARYSYAGGDTLLPTRCELWGSLASALLLLALPKVLGLNAIPVSYLAGAVVTALLLLKRQGLLRQVGWKAQWLLALLLLVAARLALHPLAPGPLQLGLGIVAGALSLAGLALWLRPWRSGTAASDPPPALRLDSASQQP